MAVRSRPVVPLFFKSRSEWPYIVENGLCSGMHSYDNAIMEKKIILISTKI